MNGCPTHCRVAAALLICGLTALAARAALAAPLAGDGDLMARAEAPAPYPTFASIPSLPADVRPISAWKAAVLATKAAGDQTVQTAKATPWSLGDSEAFAAEARAKAAPPPPVTTPSESDAEAIAAAERARASSPPRRR
jgi:hypothetical protein